MEEEKKTTKEEVAELKEQVAALMAKDAKKDVMISDLMSIADKARLANLEQNKNKRGPNRYKIGKIDGKFIVGWSTVEDKVEQTAGGMWLISQVYELMLSDGSKKDISGYTNFSNARYNDYDVVEEVERKVNSETGEISLVVRALSTGEKIEMNPKFLN